MLVYRKNPYGQMIRNRGEFNRQFNNHKQSPATNIMEGSDDFTIEMALPGFDKKDIVIDIENKILKISSKKELGENDAQTMLKREFYYGAFERQFELPETVNSEKIEANYNQGILTLIIPKLEHAKTKPAREISIA